MTAFTEQFEALGLKLGTDDKNEEADVTLGSSSWFQVTGAFLLLFFFRFR